MFVGDPTKDPAAVLIQHELKIAYHEEDGDVKEFYVAIDADDILYLQSICSGPKKQKAYAPCEKDRRSGARRRGRGIGNDNLRDRPGDGLSDLPSTNGSRVRICPSRSGSIGRAGIGRVRPCRGASGHTGKRYAGVHQKIASLSRHQQKCDPKGEIATKISEPSSQSLRIGGRARRENLSSPKAITNHPAATGSPHLTATLCQ